MGHIPGAVPIDWRADLTDDVADGEAFVLVSPDRMAAVAERAGISDGTTVVVYDDSQGVFAARAWWSLRAYGLESVRILDGGYPAWVAEGRPISNAEVLPAPAGFTVRGPNRTRLTTADVRGLLGAPDVTLLDARAPSEYRGFEGNTKRLGHIPGALNVPVGATSLPGSQHLRDGSQLRALLHAGNVSRGRRMVCYDGSGVAAAKLAFVLTLLGHEDVAVSTTAAGRSGATSSICRWIADHTAVRPGGRPPARRAPMAASRARSRERPSDRARPTDRSRDAGRGSGPGCG